jgi:hypothetical protein
MIDMLLVLSLPGILCQPDSFDWLSHDASVLDPVSSQHEPHFCGSCYAIQVAAMLSARVRVRNPGWGWQVRVSPQELLCDRANLGCMGGDTYQALLYAQQKGLPLSSEQAYNATGWTNGHPCPRAPGPRVYAKDIRLLQGEQDMQQQIINGGPIVCGVASSPLLDNYTSGVVDDPSGAKMVGHDVLVLGWGVEKGVKYWLARNSFGPGWGDKGNFKILRG